MKVLITIEDHENDPEGEVATELIERMRTDLVEYAEEFPTIVSYDGDVELNIVALEVVPG